MIADRAVTNIKLNSNVAGQGLRYNFIYFLYYRQLSDGTLEIDYNILPQRHNYQEILLIDEEYLAFFNPVIVIQPNGFPLIAVSYQSNYIYDDDSL